MESKKRGLKLSHKKSQIFNSQIKKRCSYKGEIDEADKKIGKKMKEHCSKAPLKKNSGYTETL